MNTSELINKHLTTNRISRWGELLPCPPITCADGFTFSVQASSTTYCSPRNDVGPWTAAEVGYPSLPEPLLFDYVEGFSSNWTESVYPYVPINIIAAVIECHGGFNSETLQTLNST